MGNINRLRELCTWQAASITCTTETRYVHFLKMPEYALIPMMLRAGEHIFRIFCPEYDAVDDRRGQAYLADLMETERVTDIQEALFYPVIKPIGVMIGHSFNTTISLTFEFSVL